MITYASSNASAVQSLKKKTLTPAYQYTITVSDCAHGTVTAPEKALYGEIVTLDVVPDEGYTVKKINCGGKEIKPQNGVYSFEMPDHSIEIEAEFVSAFEGESISLGGNIGVIFYLNPDMVKVGDVVSFSYPVSANGTDNTITKTYTLQSSDLKTITYDNTDHSYYAAPCYVNAAEMFSLSLIPTL